ncbi:hypothetical protein GWI33_003777 [Rhynchophorus ferrugineus]|uniref:Uncharacterized protein n=1 Tax=Rhynchophorus ferrugineus TaxID=354439 RepID=A0A834IJH7_RHYFE|nr:hypothetical protein GWI33_003777 [Rhynchophorus ferrugineus]
MGRPKKKVDNSTQTSQLFKVPFVLIDRLSSFKNPEDIFTQHESVIKKKPIVVSKLPRCYNKFADKMTKNIQANSTPVHTERVKPGPLCYKKKLLWKRPDLVRSLVRNKTCEEKMVDEENQLDPILEPINTTLISNVQLETDEMVVESISEPVLIHEGPSTNYRHLAQDSLNNQDNKKCTNITTASSIFSNKLDDKPENMSQKNQKGHSNIQAPRQKSILIKTNTVHIYNHFYNN